MSKPTGGITTTCDKCGEPCVIYPPTPEYSELLLQPCSEGDSLERPFQCGSCDEINKRYWDKKHLIIASSEPHYNSDEEELMRYRRSRL